MHLFLINPSAVSLILEVDHKQFVNDLLLFLGQVRLSQGQMSSTGLVPRWNRAPQDQTLTVRTSPFPVGAKKRNIPIIRLEGFQRSENKICKKTDIIRMFKQSNSFLSFRSSIKLLYLCVIRSCCHGKKLFFGKITWLIDRTT